MPKWNIPTESGIRFCRCTETPSIESPFPFTAKSSARRREASHFPVHAVCPGQSAWHASERQSFLQMSHSGVETGRMHCSVQKTQSPPSLLQQKICRQINRVFCQFTFFLETQFKLRNWQKSSLRLRKVIQKSYILQDATMMLKHFTGPLKGCIAC